MKIQTTPFDGLVVIELDKYSDNRGFFRETFNIRQYRSQITIPTSYVQDNESYSKKNTLRGLHFQKVPFMQGKLVRVISGKVQDVAVDLRKRSSTYGQYYSVILDGNNMMYIPEGFAHGFLALEDTFFNYKCTAYYRKEMESGIVWNDPTLKISWLINNPNELLISEKDQNLENFNCHNIYDSFNF